MTPFLKTAVAALALAGSTTIATAQEVTLRFQHFVSPKSANPTYFMEPWARKVEADSNGRIKVELYPFMQLGGKAPSQISIAWAACATSMPRPESATSPCSRAVRIRGVTVGL